MIQGLLPRTSRILSWNRSAEGAGRPALALIVSTVWIANFLHCTEFGFYEDDWYYFAAPYLYSFRSWFGMLRHEVLQFTLGRPLQNISQRVFGYIGVLLHSISALYLFAFLLFALAALLFYRVLRMRFPASFSTLAALIFVVSPLVTIKQFLNFAFTIWPGFILLFLAILIFRRRWKWLSMLLAIGALLTYESLFFLYLAAPLCRRGRFSKRRRIELLAHLAICVSLVMAYVLVRRYFAEARVSAIASGPFDTILHTAAYCVRFTLSSFQCYVYAAWVGIREAGWESVLYCTLFFVPVSLLMFRSWPAKTGRFAKARRARWLRAAAAGLLLTALGYILAYFHLGHGLFPLSGRDTRVSGAASVGSSILAAALLSLLAEFHGRLGKIVTAVFVSILFLYSFVVQRDFVEEWMHQRRFLTQAILLTPDVRAGSYYIVQTDWLMEPLFPHGARRPSIGFSRHGLQVSMQALFGWDIAPKVFFVYSDQWSRYLALRPDQKLYWTQSSFPGGWERDTNEPISPGSIITMTEDHRGVLTRTDAPLFIGGRQIVQLPQPAAGGKPESNWPYLRRSPLLQNIVPDYAMSNAMSGLSDTPTPPVQRIAGGLSLDAVVPAGEGGTIEKGPPLRIVTAAHSGYFAAGIPIHSPPALFGARYAYLRARVLSGRIGIGVVDAKTILLIRKTLDTSAAAADIYLPIVEPGRAVSLVFFNAADTDVRSEIVVEDAALVAHQ